MKRRTPIRRGKAALSRSPFRRGAVDNYSGRSMLRKVGRNSHSQDWRRVWPKLKAELERAGITRCERCGTDQRLTPAHSLKRRHITNETEMWEVALLCIECHSFYELQGEARMYPAIRIIIAGRADRLTEAA